MNKLSAREDGWSRRSRWSHEAKLFQQPWSSALNLAADCSIGKSLESKIPTLIMAITTSPEPLTVSASILPSGRGFPAASMDPECLALLAYARLLHASSPSAPPLPAGDRPLPSWFATEPARLNAAASVLWTPEDGKLPVVRCACGARKSGALSAVGHLLVVRAAGREGELGRLARRSPASGLLCVRSPGLRDLEAAFPVPEIAVKMIA